MGFKKVLAISLAVLSVGAVYVATRASKITQQFGRITMIPVALRNLKINPNNGAPLVSFLIDLQFINPSAEPFELNGTIAKLTKVMVYDAKDRLLAASYPNLKKISIPANASTVVPNIPLEVDLFTLGMNLFNFRKINAKTFKYQSVITVLGVEHIIK